MNNKDFVLSVMKRYGKAEAERLQAHADDMTGTQLYAESDFVPSFRTAAEKRNMKDRPAGFVCKSSAGRVVRLLQPYDSTIYTQEPEELPSLWGFVWSTDPAKALPFIAISTAPYNIGECCTENGETYGSLIANNVWSPSAYPQGWRKI